MNATATTREEAAAEIRKTLTDAIQSLESCTARDLILAWDNGLGVGFADGDAFSADPKPFATTLDRALSMPSYRKARPVTNGNGEEAKLVRRQDAIAAYLPELRASLAYLDGER